MSDAPQPDAATVAAALAAERHEVLALLADLTRGHGDIVAAALDSNLDDEHDPEGATIAFERAQVEALTAQARGRLQEVDAAERRLAEGRYGRCEVCGEAVAPARLEARPTARTCISCASVSRASSRGPSAPA
jgi:RNA polymerase-binding transcription factor DksA